MALLPLLLLAAVASTVAGSPQCIILPAPSCFCPDRARWGPGCDLPCSCPNGENCFRSGMCDCNFNTWGSSCEFECPKAAVPGHADPVACSGRGTCLGHPWSRGFCRCNSGFAGHACDRLATPTEPATETVTQRATKTDDVTWSGQPPTVTATHSIAETVSESLSFATPEVSATPSLRRPTTAEAPETLSQVLSTTASLDATDTAAALPTASVSTTVAVTQTAGLTQSQPVTDSVEITPSVVASDTRTESLPGTPTAEITATVAVTASATQREGWLMCSLRRWTRCHAVVAVTAHCSHRVGGQPQCTGMGGPATLWRRVAVEFGAGSVTAAHPGGGMLLPDDQPSVVAGFDLTLTRGSAVTASLEVAPRRHLRCRLRLPPMGCTAPDTPAFGAAPTAASNLAVSSAVSGSMAARAGAATTPAAPAAVDWKWSLQWGASLLSILSAAGLFAL